MPAQYSQRQPGQRQHRPLREQLAVQVERAADDDHQRVPPLGGVVGVFIRDGHQPDVEAHSASGRPKSGNRSDGNVMISAISSPSMRSTSIATGLKSSSPGLRV